MRIEIRIHQLTQHSNRLSSQDELFVVGIYLGSFRDCTRSLQNLWHDTGYIFMCPEYIFIRMNTRGWSVRPRKRIFVFTSKQNTLIIGFHEGVEKPHQFCQYYFLNKYYVFLAVGTTVLLIYVKSLHLRVR
jgi:hypothetical protein